VISRICIMSGRGAAVGKCSLLFYFTVVCREGQRLTRAKQIIHQTEPGDVVSRIV